MSRIALTPDFSLLASRFFLAPRHNRWNMKISYTPAVERALALAAGWSAGGEATPIDLPELLLALLAEPECRAARLLAEQRIDAGVVRGRWPNLTRCIENQALRTGNYTSKLRDILWELREWLSERGEREVATEHLLWAMARGDDDVAIWLRDHGVSAHAFDGERIDDAAPIDVALDELGREIEAQDAPVLESRQTSVERSSPEVAVWRTLDAAGNRAREGLRVVEDYVRFGLDDRHLTERLKAFRHELSAALALLPEGNLLASRDTAADVGTTITTESEGHRPDIGSVAVASLKRIGEALRSLEEFGKVVDPAVGARIEGLRYRLYTLEKAVGLTRGSLAKLADSRLYVLVDGRGSASEFESLVASLIAAPVDVIQFRDKKLPDRELLARGRLLRELTGDSQTLFIMNDRPDLAVLSEADGVHVGQEELSVKAVRQIVGPATLVGVSTHSLTEAEQAVLDGASYIGVGPTFPSTTKQFTAFTGLELLRRVASNIRLPAFAIGGINLENVDQVLNAGMTRIAVSAAITQATDPRAAAKQLRAMLLNEQLQ
jgi:thiamine-phosphate pyrophosphorylase